LNFKCQAENLSNSVGHFGILKDAKDFNKDSFVLASWIAMIR